MNQRFEAMDKRFKNPDMEQNMQHCIKSGKQLIFIQAGYVSIKVHCYYILCTLIYGNCQFR